jgi:hypothetical protein
MTSLKTLTQEISRRQNDDATKRAQCQEILISRDDVSSLSCDCQFKELVVLGITAFPQTGCHEHVLRVANVCGKKLQSLLLAHILSKFWPSQNVVQFLEHRFGNQQLPVLQSRVKGSPGRRSEEHQRADDDVGVEDDPHITPRRVSTRAIRASGLFSSPHAPPRPESRRGVVRAESSALEAAVVTTAATAVAGPQTRIDRRLQSRHPRGWR